MDWILIAFFVFAIVALGGALYMLNLYKVVHMVVALAFTFFGLAGLYVLLEAEFIAFAQIMVYSGAITILMLYGIMMTRHDAEDIPIRRPVHTFFAVAGVGGLFVFLLYGIMSTPWPDASAEPLAENNIKELGLALFNKYVIPFELAAILLLVALVGAVVLAKREVEE